MDKISNLKPLKTKSAKGLRTLLTTLSEAIAALRALGCAVHHWNPLLLHQLVRLLDPDTCEAWKVKLGSTTTYPTFLQFEEFLIGRTRAMENLDLASNAGSNKELATTSSGKFRLRTAAHATASQNSEQSSCPLCKASHFLGRCESYKSKTIQQRRDFIIKNRRCFNCLAQHMVNKCNSVKRCLKCGKNTTLLFTIMTKLLYKLILTRQRRILLHRLQRSRSLPQHD